MWLFTSDSTVIKNYKISLKIYSWSCYVKLEWVVFEKDRFYIAKFMKQTMKKIIDSVNIKIYIINKGIDYADVTLILSNLNLKSNHFLKFVNGEYWLHNWFLDYYSLEIFNSP